MLKNVFNLFKKIVFTIFLLYGYNLIATSFNLIIPINLITVLMISIFGIPALFSFMVISLSIF